MTPKPPFAGRPVHQVLQGLARLNSVLGDSKILLQQVRPPGGWLRAVRHGAEMTATEIAERMGVSRQLPLKLEIAEAHDRITLRSLRSAAEALDCEFVYALVPREGPVRDTIEHRIRLAQKFLDEVDLLPSEHIKDYEGPSPSETIPLVPPKRGE